MSINEFMEIFDVDILLDTNKRIDTSKRQKMLKMFR